MTEIERINAILRRSDIKTWADVITEENKTLRFEKSFDHKEFEIAFLICTHLKRNLLFACA